MKIYTKTGDKGTTDLFSGGRVKKNSRRVEAYGTVDEINSALGIARAAAAKAEVKETVFKIQKMLIILMAELASSDAGHNGKNTKYITKEHIAEIETLIDQFARNLKPLKNFIMPGDNMASAFFDLARTVVRRGERHVLNLFEEEEISLEDNNILIVLNRLSDLCFVLSRFERESA